MSADDQAMPALDAEAAMFISPGEHMLCYACRKEGRCRLGIRRFIPQADQSVLAEVVCPASWEGGPMVAHGGWTAATFDEVLGHIGPLQGALTVTGTLTIEYVKPVPVERDLEVRARVERVEGRRWYLAGEMTLKSTGAVLGRAKGIFVQRNRSHFENHRKWMEEQDETGAAGA
jgi:acyl-coenzyme A thioesterase PaaI-like protein